MRLLDNWIESFFDYTEYLPSPELYRKWVAIAAVAGALERRVWVKSQNALLYPNLYTILIGPPGVGKSVLTVKVEELWRDLPDHYVASSNITKAALMDELNAAVRTIIRPKETPATITFNSLKILSNELGVLLPAYEGEFMSTLTDLYDGSRYAERRRATKDNPMDIPRPQFNLLAATTPGHLHDFLPVGAFDQGFLSRCFLIYSGDIMLRPLFTVATGSDDLWKNLRKDLRVIGNMYGQMKFTPEAAEAINTWHMTGRTPVPGHPKLVNYSVRRTLHLLKLCMVSCASSAEDLVITLEHYTEALGWLLEAETFMPDIFKSMNSGGDSKVIEDCWYFCFQRYAQKQQPIPEFMVFQFLQERVPSHSVERMVEMMLRANRLKAVMLSGVGRAFKPLPKND
jgi:hypothetical protein